MSQSRTTPGTIRAALARQRVRPVRYTLAVVYNNLAEEGRFVVVRIGMIGAGFIARLHATALRSLGPDAAQIVGVAARRERPREAFASEFGIRDTYADYRRLLERADVDAVDLCVPNHLHHPMTVAAAQAGKHVYCEKPLTGYFGRGEAAEQVSKTPREVMLRETLADADEMLAACAASGVQLCYGEDWVYSPVLEKARRLVQVSSSPIMELRGEESHNGSHADYAKRWATSGGGALLRLGVHPIGAALQLKRWEGQLRQGRPIRAAAVTAEVATLTDIGGVPARRGVVARHRLGRRGELVHHHHPFRGRFARRLHCLRQHPRRHCQLSGADPGARAHQVQHDAQQYVRSLRPRRHGLG